MDDLIVENVKRGVVDVAKSEVSPSLSLPSHGFSRWRHASQSGSYISSEANSEPNISQTRDPIHDRRHRSSRNNGPKRPKKGPSPSTYTDG